MNTSTKTIITLCAYFLAIEIPNIVLAQNTCAYAPGIVIVKFRDQPSTLKKSNSLFSSGFQKVDAVIQRYNVLENKALFVAENADQDLRASLGLDRIFILRFAPSIDVRTIIDDLSKLQDVEYAEPDYVGQGAGVAQIDSIVPIDPYFDRQWAFRNTGSNLSPNSGKIGADIKATMGWPICKGDSNIIVADLDSGLKWDHPDIVDRVWANKKEIAGNGIDDDKNGFIDDVHGWNFAYNNNNVSDDYGHGSNTASIIASKSNNGLGYTGLDWACKIMPLKELDSTNYGYYSWWASALFYAANNGARVINMSEGGTGNSQTLKTAIDYAYAHGCFIAAAMMNSNDSTRYYPAAYDDHVVAVGATDSYDRRCNPFSWGGGSNYGSWINVVAPGNKIYGITNKSNTDYTRYWGGTSQATPMVVGLAALLIAQDTKRDPAMLREIIRATADDTVGLPTEDKVGYDVHYGYGRINCYRALTYSYSGVPAENRRTPSDWALSQNYPNPFNPSTIIHYHFPTVSFVTLKVYDVLGREVRTLVNQLENAGNHSVIFNAYNLPSGIYFYRLSATPLTQRDLGSTNVRDGQTGLYTETKKLVLLK